MAEEMNDYSGPFKPNLRFEDFSKEFLLKLMHVWQYAWLHMSEGWWNAVSKRYGHQVADDCELDAWLWVGTKVNPRYAKLANIELNTVADCLKLQQLPLDNMTGGLFLGEWEIVNPNHVIFTINRCRSLEAFEKSDPQRIYHVCHVADAQVLKAYLVHPKIKVTPLKLPPRESPDDIPCKWAFTMEE